MNVQLEIQIHRIIMELVLRLNPIKLGLAFSRLKGATSLSKKKILQIKGAT